jgi:eukaryotic-like serine/threonine-protein kinase
MQFEAGERFEIRERLGAGSFGVVYEAFDRHRNRLVALKALEHVAADTIARFKREFRFLSEVRHPNLASMYELVVVGDRWLLTMELIEGIDMLEYLARAELQHAFLETARTPTLRVSDGGLSPHGISPRSPVSALSDIYLAHVRDCFKQLATGLAALHAQGIVHRDIKPSNIMITAEGRVVLLDFGLVIEIELDDTIDRKTVVGTPGYMSPEQMTASAASAASDWYSVGALLYQALTGMMPFTGQNPLEILQNQMHGELRPAADVVPGTPADLDELCRDLLRPDPSHRPSDSNILARLGVSEQGVRHEERTHIRSAKLIGRRRELAALRMELDRAQPGSPRLVTLHGAPGVGKTTVADSFLDEAREQFGAFVIGARCHAWESVPLNAIDGAVDSLARHIRHHHPPAVEEAIARSAAVMRLFPALDTQPSTSRDDETIFIPSGDKLITRGASELTSILCVAAGDKPLVVFLDDVQWGDFLSARVVSRMLEPSTSACPILVVACYRTEDWRTSMFLQYLLGMHPPERDVELKRFARVSAKKLAAAAMRDVSQDVIQRVAAAADGNPTLIELIAEWPGTIHSRPKDPLLAFAIDYRLDRLSSAARAVYELLLVADRPLEASVIENALELFESDEPLRTLSREHLIRSRITGDLIEVDVYHSRMRRTVNDLVSKRRQEELRERLG